MISPSSQRSTGLLAWFAANPVVSSVIAGATKPEQVEQNAKAAGWVLSADELAEIDKISAKV